MKRSADFSILPEGFFLHWMDEGRNLSVRTIAAYRDTSMLFLTWMEAHRGIKADHVTMDDFTAESVEAFLTHLHDACGNSPVTVNYRLAAIRSFCNYAIYRDPARISSIRQILDILRRIEQRSGPSYLSGTEIGWLLAACDSRKDSDRTVHLMIGLLYNTGARVGEWVSVRVEGIESSEGGSHVRIVGKERTSV